MPLPTDFTISLDTVRDPRDPFHNREGNDPHGLNPAPAARHLAVIIARLYHDANLRRMYSMSSQSSGSFPMELALLARGNQIPGLSQSAQLWQEVPNQIVPTYSTLYGFPCQIIGCARPWYVNVVVQFWPVVDIDVDDMLNTDFPGMP